MLKMVPEIGVLIGAHLFGTRKAMQAYFVIRLKEPPLQFRSCRVGSESQFVACDLRGVVASTDPLEAGESEPDRRK